MCCVGDPSIIWRRSYSLRGESKIGSTDTKITIERQRCRSQLLGSRQSAKARNPHAGDAEFRWG